MSYQLINGYTIESMKAMIRKYVGEDRCMTPDKAMCAYRNGPNRCAVGAFMPDSCSDEAFDSLVGAEDLISEHALEAFMPLEPEALEDFQDCHDRSVRSESTQADLLDWIDRNVEETK